MRKKKRIVEVSVAAADGSTSSGLAQRYIPFSTEVYCIDTLSSFKFIECDCVTNAAQMYTRTLQALVAADSFCLVQPNSPTD